MITWLKSQRWIVTTGMVLTAIFLALAGAKSVKRSSRAKRSEDKATELMRSGVRKDLRRAEKLISSAGKDKAIAKKAKETMKAQLEKLGETNSDIDAIAAAFNSRKLRRAATKT